MNIKNYRIKRGLSQREIAEKLNVTQSNYSKYERGDIEPNLTTLILLSKEFHVSIDELIGNSDNKVKGNREELLEKVSFLTDEECKKLCNFVEEILASRNK